MANIKKRISFRFMRSLPEIIKNIFRSRVTINFPVDNVPLPDGFRGSPILIDPSNCIACGRCENVCPSHCIAMTVIDEETMEYDLSFNLAQCLYCGVCTENCSKKSIEMSSNWLLADVNKDSMLKTYKVRRPQKKRMKK